MTEATKPDFEHKEAEWFLCNKSDKTTGIFKIQIIVKIFNSIKLHKSKYATVTLKTEFVVIPKAF